MHSEVMEFLGRMKARRPDVFAAGRVLECGAYNINGSARGLFEAAEYIGLDWRPGPGVDVVNFVDQYEDPIWFDTVISTEMLEHDPLWRESLRNMVRLLRPGGSLIVTCAGPERPRHEVDCSPEDGYYRGLSAVEVVRELRRAGEWQRIHAEQVGITGARPSDTYVACFGLLTYRALAENESGMIPYTVSVVIPAVGLPALTRAAVGMARENAGMPCEIVLVDNGSLPENAERLADSGADVYLRYDAMLGYPAACNRGIEVSAGEFVCLLNNDAEPATAGWARGLVKTLEGWPADIVSPVTDFVANPPQKARPASDRKAPRHPFGVEKLFFVCVLMRRTLFAAVGLLDEAFGLGNSEDEEFCLRVKRAGGTLVVDPGVFVRHEGHATFGRLPEGLFAGLLAANRTLLAQKMTEQKG